MRVLSWILTTKPGGGAAPTPESTVALCGVESRGLMSCVIQAAPCLLLHSPGSAQWVRAGRKYASGLVPYLGNCLFILSPQARGCDVGGLGGLGDGEDWEDWEGWEDWED